MKINKVLEQQKEELAVFENFMQVCKYPIIKESIKQQAPPKPDIFCTLKNGTAIEFELTNSVDQQLARKMNDCRILDKGGFINDEPVERMIVNKIDKFKKNKYKQSTERFELLVYLGLMPLFPYHWKTIPQLLERKRNEQGFDKIWIFKDDQINPQILWFSELKND